MENYKEFINSRSTPPLDRNKSKYYPEMQQLAYNLIRYLNMNNNPNENNPCQGNYNVTYLIENMSESEFHNIIRTLIRRIPLGKLKDLILDSINSEYGQTIIESFENKVKEMNINTEEEEKYLIEVNLNNDTYEWFTANEGNLTNRILEIKDNFDIKKISLYERKFEIR